LPRNALVAQLSQVIHSLSYPSELLESNAAWTGRLHPIPSVQPYEAEAELLAALGVERSELPVELYDERNTTVEAIRRGAADPDAGAARVLLEDFLAAHR